MVFLDSLQSVLSELTTEPGLPYPHGFFLPHVTPGYANSRTKIFYYGLDTRWWMDTDELWGYEVMMKEFKAGRLKRYLADMNNGWPSKPEQILAWGNRYAFWPFVIRLHFLMTRDEWIDDLYSLSDGQKESLMNFGYGNVHPLECKQSLEKEKYGPEEDKKRCWDAITNVDAYYKACTLMDERITLKTVLDEYAPDCVFVHAWSWSEEVLFKGLRWKGIKIKEPGAWAAYSFDGYKAKLLCMPHPNALTRNYGQDFYETIKDAARLMRLLKKAD